MRSYESYENDEEKRDTMKYKYMVDLLIFSDVKGLKFYGMVEELRTSLRKHVELLELLEDEQMNM